MLTRTNTIGRTFSRSVVPESQIRDRLTIYQYARTLNGTDEDDHPGPDNVLFNKDGLLTEVILSADRLLARTSDEQGRVVSLEKVEETLLLVTRQADGSVAQEAEEMPNGDGYWMEGEWFIKSLPQPSTVFETLNQEFEREWSKGSRTD